MLTAKLTDEKLAAFLKPYTTAYGWPIVAGSPTDTEQALEIARRMLKAQRAEQNRRMKGRLNHEDRSR